MTKEDLIFNRERILMEIIMPTENKDQDYEDLRESYKTDPREQFQNIFRQAFRLGWQRRDELVVRVLQ